MINISEAILSLIPDAEFIVEDDTVIQWIKPTTAPLTDEQIQAELVKLQFEEEVAKQAQIAAKQSALNKLMALGLTEEEALALGVK